MIAYCGRPAAAAFCDPFPYIDPRYARETIAEIRSLGVALATAIINQTGSKVREILGALKPPAYRLSARGRARHAGTAH